MSNEERKVGSARRSKSGLFATLRASLHTEGTGAPSHRRFGLCGALACLAALAILPSAASADQTRLLANSFGTLSDPSGIAIDQSTGDVYVADTADHRIEKFDSTGDLLLVFGADVGGPGVDTCTSGCVPGTAGSGPGAFEGSFHEIENDADGERLFLAVDEDPTSLSFHDVYVGDPGDDLVSKFDAEGHLITTWGDNGPGESANGELAGPAGRRFGLLGGIAVDPSGNLDVYEDEIPHALFQFTQAGGFSDELAPERGTKARGLALDAAGDFFKVNGDGSVEEYDAAAADIGTVTLDTQSAGATPPVADAFAIEPAGGDLYVATAGRSLDHYAFDPAGEVEEPGGAACKVEARVGCDPTDSVAIPFAATGIAVSSATGDTYLSEPGAGQVDVYGPPVAIPHAVTEHASEEGPHTATLNGEVDPAGEPVTECFFGYLSRLERERNEAEGREPFAGAAKASCEPEAAAIPVDGVAHPVEARITGLTAGVAYDYRLIAADAADAGKVPNPGADVVLHTSPPPAIDEAIATEITATSAKLTAKIDPEGFPTRYHLEYGPTTTYGTVVPVPDGEVGPGRQPETVSQEATGLSPNVTYHWRVVAESADGTTTGVDHTFIFLTGSEVEGGCENEALRTGESAHLPDCRAYEMVTPPHKNGAVIGDVTLVGLRPSLAADGERLIAGAIQCFAGATSCNASKGDGVGSPYSFTRTPAGWQTTPLAPPATAFPTNTPWAYSADSGAALFSMPTPPQGEDDFYRREADGGFADVGPITPPAEGARGPLGGKVGAIRQAQTADLSHVVWDTEVSGRWPFDATASSTVYEYVGAGNREPLLVAVAGGEHNLGTDEPDSELISRCGATLGSSENGTEPGILSADGRTVYFTALRCSAAQNGGTELPANQLYARIDGETAAARTVRIAQSECGAGSASDELACREAASEPAPAGFWGASADGAKVFFTSIQQLTDEASEDSTAGDNKKSGEQAASRCETAGPGGCNLYLYTDPQEVPLMGDHLTDVSTGDTSGRGPQVQGVMAISSDGSHVYFVAKGVLAANEGAEGETAQAGADNLYAWQRDAEFPAGHTAFVATLSPSDRGEWAQTGQPANVTPDGRFLVFTSHADLTADDTSVGGARQTFRYDARTGELDRVSIGERGFDDDGNRSAATLCDATSCSEDASIAPAGVSTRSDPTMSDDGTKVFFESPVGLTPGALDDVRVGTDEEGDPVYAQNVYEWEQAGAGGCAQAAGCVSLISDGKDTTANNGNVPYCGLATVCLLGTDVTGRDVFFTTADRLVGSDTDAEVDFYDAREGGGFAEPAPREICESSEKCPGPGTSPAPAQAHGTAGFNGPEGSANTERTKCRKGQVKKHGHCVARKPARHHKKKHHKKHHGRTGKTGRAGK